MLKLILAAAVALGAGTAAYAADVVQPKIVAAPPIVPSKPGPQGYLGIGGGRWSEVGILTTNAYQIDGAVNVPVGVGAINIELEGSAFGILTSGISETLHSSAMAHLVLRNGRWALGAYGGLDAPFGLALWTYGAEAQLYLNFLRVTGQVAGISGDSGSGLSGSSARAEVMAFLGQNVAIAAGYRRATLNSAVTSNEWDVTGEARLGSSPWAAFVSYRDVGFSGQDLTTWLGGVRVHLGNMTLRQAYTSGATFDTRSAYLY